MPIRKFRFVILSLCFLLSLENFAETGFNIWEGTVCRAEAKLTPYLAEGGDSVAVIGCPGGSYFWLDKATEGECVARWLQKAGISAFVLEYRVGGVLAFITHCRLLFRGNRYPDMLQDVQRSVQLVRENAGTFGINPRRVGVMGFSAGGHLAIMAGEFFDSGVLELAGVTPSVSLKPDFIVPVYPVVTLNKKPAHKRSRRGMLGEWKSISSEMKDSLSLEEHVRNDMPPVFLVNCKDDPVVDYRNSELLDSALTSHGVPHRYFQFKAGGHGFGADGGRTTKEAIRWKELFVNWLNELFE